MLQIRTAAGAIVPVPEGQFVEIVSDDQTIGMVFFQLPGSIVQVIPGSTDAHRYAEMFGVKFNKVMVQRR
jgi:hypothetical protein